MAASIHEQNTKILLTTFLPYHSIPAFATLLSILPAKIPTEFRFLDPYIRALTPPPRSVLVHQAIHHPEFLYFVSEYTLESCRKQCQYPALITFWGGLATEALNGLLDRTRSGRAAIQSDQIQTLLHRIGPVFVESLVMKKVPSLQIASYMALSLFVSKANLEDVAVTAFMEQTVHGWTSESVRPALVCLAIMAQFRSAKQMSSKVTKALMKVPDIGHLLVQIGQERRVDKLANGLCLALIERFTKKSDSSGLQTVMEILSSRILVDQQTAVILKSLLLTALRLDDSRDEHGALRRELGSALIDLSHATGRSGDIFQSVIDEVDFDIEKLEMKLDVSFRARTLCGSSTGADEKSRSEPVDQVPPPQDLEAAVDKLSARKEPLPPSLLPRANKVFDDFSHLFFAIVSDQSRHGTTLTKFDHSPKLRRESAFKDCTYCGFYIRVWCGPYPALARAAALDMVKNRLKEGGGNTDFQALVPYCVSALGDPSKRVRRVAAGLMTTLASLYSPPLTVGSMKAWGAGSLYGPCKDAAALGADVTAKLLHLQIAPTVEECVMDEKHISWVLKSALEQGKYQVQPPPALDKKDHMSHKARLAFMSFFAHHANATPHVIVKNRLLKTLNEVGRVGGATRTQALLPVLQWWISLSEEETEETCRQDRLDRSDLDSRFTQVVARDDAAGLEFLFKILKDPSKREKTSLMRAIFARIRKMWPSMKDPVKFMVAEHLLELSQEPAAAEDASDAVVAGEAADVLRAVPLTTEILSLFLSSIQTGTKTITEPPPNKRRRTSSPEGSRGLTTQVTPELSQALRKVTFVLQLVENSGPESHPELLDGLFTALSELQHFGTMVGSELGYLQNLILRSLLAMMPAYRSDKELKIDGSGGYGDLLVNCIQKSSSPVVQNAALLLVADLATTAPSLVLHSVMPIFTFMGASVLRQSDDYSAHVVSQTIKEVIPPLIESLKRNQKSPVAGACDIIVSFTTAYEHIPTHRRQGLFAALVKTLGPRDFLFALVGMLVDRYDTSDALLDFIADLVTTFGVETQLETLVKLVDVVSDLLSPKPGISRVLFGSGDDGEGMDAEKIALRQVSALASLLSSAVLRAQMGELANRDDMEASEVRALYGGLLEKILLLADTVKANKTLHGRCGAALSNLLNLLSIGKFMAAVEDLLDRPDVSLRHKVLRALETRVEAEKRTDPASRKALLAFVPQLTAAIRESSDMRHKYTAVTCVDKIVEKYGKKDLEAAAAAAATIAGEHCLGQGERRLRVMALLCLTSLVEVLQDAVVPVLSAATPRVVSYLEESLQGETPDEELHSACYGFISSLGEYVPYMVSTCIDQVLATSSRSAEAGLRDKVTKSRLACLGILARRLEAKDMFGSLARNWETALGAGFSVSAPAARVGEERTRANGRAQATSEFLEVLGTTTDKQPTSAMTKNAASVGGIVLQALDVRRRVDAAGQRGEATLAQVARIEEAVGEKALKMIYKLNDAALRPMLARTMEWAGSGLPREEGRGRVLRQLSVFGFLRVLFGQLKSIVTGYATYVVEEAVQILRAGGTKTGEERALKARVLQTLATCFEYDQDDFWQAPARFGAVAAALMEQLGAASAAAAAGGAEGTEELVTAAMAAVVELAAAADSPAHQKELNGALLRHLRSEQAAVRLAAVRCEQALTDRLGEEWLAMLHEMLPRISELQQDDDEAVERETHRWIVKIEGVLGESLDAMLQ